MRNSQFSSPVRWLVLLSILFLCAVAPGFAQEEQSPAASLHLRVVVTDSHERSLPGAVCSLSRASEQTIIATATTDEQGVATFNSLAPGNYTLRIEKRSFEPLTKTDVLINENLSSELKLTLSVAQVKENVTVSTPDEALTTSVEVGASTPAGNLKREEMRKLPLGNARVEEALPLVPGVVRSSTGEISIKGATEQQSALIINGANASDPATGNFRLNLPLDSVEAVQVFQHPYTAEYGQFIGGVTSVGTRRGDDHWHYELNDFLPDLRFKGGKVVGIAEDEPRLNFNGPLIADRLYLSQSLTYAISKAPVRGLSFPNNETKTERESYFTQLDLTLNGRHTQTFTFGYFPERDQFVGLDFFRPQPVTPNYRQRDFSFTARDNYALNDGLLETVISFKRFDANVWGQGTEDQTLTPTVEEGNYFATQDRRSGRFELLEIYTLPVVKFLSGTHELKFGFNFNRVSDHLLFNARPVNIVREDSTLAERIMFDLHPERRIPARNHEYSAFAQDRWIVRRNLSFDLGLRYENQSIANEKNLAPRAGFAWSPFEDGRTVVRGGIGYFYDKVPLNIRGFRRYPSRLVTLYAADGQTIIDQRAFTNVLVSTAPVAPLDFRHSDRDAGFVPENLTWNLQLDQTITSWLMLRANYTNSTTSHIYIVNPELDYNGLSAIVLRSAGHAEYHALELTARIRAPKQNTFYISYVRSRARGDLNDFNSYFGDFGNPIVRQNQFSNLPFDTPNRLVAWGTLTLPRNITLAPIFEARSGFPYSVRDAEQNFVGLRNADERRFPRFVALDMEVSKKFQVTKKYGMTLSLRVYNVTNHFNPRDVRTNIADPQFGQFFAPYHRYITGGFDIIY
jgi:hypothetical protein